MPNTLMRADEIVPAMLRTIQDLAPGATAAERKMLFYIAFNGDLRGHEKEASAALAKVKEYPPARAE